MHSFALALAVTVVAATTATPALWFGYEPNVVTFAVAGTVLSLASPGGSKTLGSMLFAGALSLVVGISAPPALFEGTYMRGFAAFVIAFSGAELPLKVREAMQGLDVKARINTWLDQRLGPADTTGGPDAD